MVYRVEGRGKIMKRYKLDAEEKRILEDFEKGEFVSVKNLAKVKRELQAIAKNTLSINLRLSEKVVAKLKVKAAEEGIPYQTLASSVLHRFANKQTTGSSL